MRKSGRIFGQDVPRLVYRIFAKLLASLAYDLLTKWSSGVKCEIIPMPSEYSNVAYRDSHRLNYVQVSKNSESKNLKNSGANV